MFDIPTATYIVLGGIFITAEFFNLYYHFQFSHYEELAARNINDDPDAKFEHVELVRHEAFINSLAIENIEKDYGLNVMKVADIAWTGAAFAVLFVLICASE